MSYTRTAVSEKEESKTDNVYEQASGFSHYRFRAEYLITGDDNGKKIILIKISVMRVENEEIINIIERVPCIKIPCTKEVDTSI